MPFAVCYLMPPNAITSSENNAGETGMFIIPGFVLLLVTKSACDTKEFKHVVAESLSSKTEDTSFL
jgi:hypothetical protein